MKEIVLTTGEVTQVSDEDFDSLNQFLWCLSGEYASTTHLYMAHVVLTRTGIVIPEGKEIDHIDRNKLNNQRENLRAVTRSQNCHNADLRSNNISGHRGVFFDQERQKWCAFLTINGIRMRLGRYNTIEEAIAVRESAERRFLKWV